MDQLYFHPANPFSLSQKLVFAKQILCFTASLPHVDSAILVESWVLVWKLNYPQQMTCQQKIQTSKRSCGFQAFSNVAKLQVDRWDAEFPLWGHGLHLTPRHVGSGGGPWTPLRRLGAVLHEGGTTSKGRQKERNHNIWVNYNDLTTTSLEIMVSKGNHPQMALIQVSEIL